ncbi:AfsR/SARP family transcriptional regulator [Streptomyces sp. NPDC090025]|uniref:AfsR/SARP family transcriptional regulator n=1 Tax=Streptomyces sp. NPDC090025 TaxID=3365922 RepID=UPI0038353FC5
MGSDVPEGRVLGRVGIDVAGRSHGIGLQSVRLFAALVTSPEGLAGADEVMGFLWPGEDVPRNRLHVALRELRKMVGAEYVSSRTQDFCSISIPPERVDLHRYRMAVGRAKATKKDPHTCFEHVVAAWEEWPEGRALTGLEGAAFRLRRAELDQEWFGAALFGFCVAADAREFDWLFKKTDEVRRTRDRNEMVFFHHLRASQGIGISRKQLLDMIRTWRTENDVKSPELNDLIASLRPASSGRPRAPKAAATPRQLPLPGRNLVGRDAQLRGLERELLARRADGRACVVLLSGMPGVGKSALALELAHRLAPHHPGGHLYAALRGFVGGGVEPAAPEEIIDEFLASFSIRTKATTLEGKAKALRTALSQRSVLVLLDDAVDVEQIRELLPGPGACTVIVTSRNAMKGMRTRLGAAVEAVGLLDAESSRALLEESVDPALSRLIGELVAHCGGLPLALSVTAERIRGLPEEAIAAMVRHLGEERSRLDELHLQEAELSVRLALDNSVGHLTSPARTLLRQLAVHPGPTISWSAAVDLGRVAGGGQAVRPLEELLAAHLIEMPTSGRYRLHDLIRVHARHHMRPEPGDPAVPFLEARTCEAIVAHQLHQVWACDQILDPERRLPIPEPDGCHVQPPPDEHKAMSVLDAEYETSVEVTELAMREGMTRSAWLMAMALVTYLWRRNRYATAERLLWAVRSATDEIEDIGARAMYHRMVAGCQNNEGRYAEAAEQLRAAVDLDEQDTSDGSRLGLARSLLGLAIVLRRLQQATESEEHYVRAMALFKAAENRRGEAAALNGLGTLRCDDGQYDAALAMCADALELAEPAGDRNLTANILTTQGKIRVARAEREPALDAYERATALYRGLDYRSKEAMVLRRRADILKSAGRRVEAIGVLEREVILRELLGDAEQLRIAMADLESLR